MEPPGRPARTVRPLRGARVRPLPKRRGTLRAVLRGLVAPTTNRSPLFAGDDRENLCRAARPRRRAVGDREWPGHLRAPLRQPARRAAVSGREASGVFPVVVRSLPAMN